MPITKARVILLLFSFSKAFGMNSYTDISIIIPAVIAKIMLRRKLLIYFCRKMYEMIAPSNSEKPAISVYKKAFNLLLVE